MSDAASTTTMDIDETRFEYAPGHSDKCCIIRRSPTEFEVRGRTLTHIYGAAHVGLIIEQAYNLRATHGMPAEDVPGYITFARIANVHWANFQLPTYDPKHVPAPDNPYTLSNNEKPIPPRELFEVEPRQCLEPGEEVLQPGFVSVPADDHNAMTSITLRRALHIERNAAIRIKDKAAKRRQRRTAKTGTLGFINPMEKARMEEARRASSSKNRS